MKLSYRGIQYNQSAIAVNAEVAEEFGKYRGQEYLISNVDNLSLKRSRSRRVYRGVTYS